MGDQRPGDNLYTSSVIGLDTATGKIKGFHQYHPNDSWDWDEVSPPILVDYQHNGKTIKGCRCRARRLFVDAGAYWRQDQLRDGKPFVKQNVFQSLDPETGRPHIDAARQPGPGKSRFLPLTGGGKDWPPVAYSPKTRLLYIPANENLCGTIIGELVTYTPGQRYVGATSTMYIAPGADHIGEAAGMEPRHRSKGVELSLATSQLWGPVLATGGGVLFAGGTNDRYFRAFDASNGKTLWEFRTGSGVNGVPVSFQIDGKQYIAVQSGWGVDAARMQARLNLARPWEYPEVPQGGSVWVFAVD